MVTSLRFALFGQYCYAPALSLCHALIFFSGSTLMCTTSVTPQLYLCATRWSSLAFLPLCVPPVRFSVSHTGLLRQLPRSRWLADTVSFCVGIAHPPRSFLFGSCQALCFPIMVTVSHARAASLLVPSSILSCMRESVSRPILTNSLRTESLTLLRFSQLISKTLTRLITVRWLDLYVLVYKPVVKIIVASDLISFVNNSFVNSGP